MTDDGAEIVDGELDLHAALTALEQARAAAAAGDPAGCVRALRGVPDGLPMGDRASFLDILHLVRDAASAMGFDDLAKAADNARADPDDPHALYGYGYACIERGAPWLAVPALALAVAYIPKAQPIRFELASALEAETRYAEAVTVLADDSVLDLWMGRYLLVFELLMSGDVEGARQWYSRLGKPGEEAHRPLADRLTAMLTRVQTLTGSSRLDDSGHDGDPTRPLGEADLRGWHFALNGGVLTTLSPYGFAEGMTGRYAFLNETAAGLRRGLDRLAVVLVTSGRRPTAVGLLPDRSSRILGLAAATLLDLPARDWRPDDAGSLTVAFTLSELDADTLTALRGAPDQLLVEHATCWTDPPTVAADVTTLLHQVVTAPWEEHRRPAPGGGGWLHETADDRPEEELAVEIVTAPTKTALGDGQTPDDSDAVLADFVRTVAQRWGSGHAPRDKVWSPGPVPSSRFW